MQTQSDLTRHGAGAVLAHHGLDRSALMWIAPQNRADRPARRPRDVVTFACDLDINDSDAKTTLAVGIPSAALVPPARTTVLGKHG